MAQAVNIADFYHQLGLLVKAEMPLPEGLRHLAADVSGSKLKQAIGELSAHVANGGSLSDGMRRHPGVFPDLHIRLVEAGEQTGGLDETLFTIANLSYFNHYLISRARQTLAYPWLTICVAGAVLGLLGIYIVPGFARIFDDMLPGEPLPSLTRLVTGLSSLLQTWVVPIGLLYAAVVFFGVWLLTRASTTNRALLTTIGMLPGSLRISHAVESAQLARLLSGFLRHGIPTAEALRLSSELTPSGSSAEVLGRVARRHAEGQPLGEAFAQEPRIDRLLALTIRQTAEQDLPAELGRLAELFERRVVMSARTAIALWELLALIGMTVVVGGTVLSLFLPLVKLVSCLGG